MMNELGIATSELDESYIMIQGFKQGGYRSMGCIKLGIHMDDFQSNPLMHVIDAKTSYNILLGRPWVHGNKIISSSYYQCLKYLEGEVERKVVTDDKPFNEDESHFADAKFYLKNHIIDEKRFEDVTKTKCDDVTPRIQVRVLTYSGTCIGLIYMELFFFILFIPKFARRWFHTKVIE